MPSGKCMIIGLGDIGLQLVRSLSRNISLICVDTSPELLEVARQLRSEGLETFLGDATSRLALEKAGARKVDTILITTTSEDVNIEVARVLREHFNVPRVVALGITRGGIKTLEKYDVEVEGIFTASATFLRNRVEFKSKTVQGIGLGKNEILEVEVHGHSRLAGKALGSLNPRSWRVGLVYRDGNIVIPSDDTVLRAKDKVVLLGDPQVLKTVTDLLTFRFKHFPLEFGDTLVAFLPENPEPRYLEELGYLLSVFPLEKALFVCRRPDSGLEAELRQLGETQHVRELRFAAAEEDEPCLAVREAVREIGPDVSMVVLPSGQTLGRGLPFFGARIAKRCLQRLSASVGCPVLLAAGSFPYAGVAVPATAAAGFRHALETTLEMSASIRYRIDALFVTPSEYIASEEEKLLDDGMRKAASELSLVYRTAIRQVDLEGNPVRAIGAALEGYNLMVGDVGSWRPEGRLFPLLRPDVAWSLVRRAGISTLLMPPAEKFA
jgi:trk/ktr system potassium uptake protein